ncbi:MAG TPA: prepilin-type N-terminal cleavage/methylation domain-containing protein [Candidatus Acidoferrales bacterium]|nr:prepilin-type N-terminal cleavage/methylation domain-containing protein [Candidatus Acidoferrales bacterium]
MKITRDCKTYRGARRMAGFTLLEMMVVITIITVLLGVAAVRYERSITRSKEAVLRQDLFTLRQAIDQFTLDKQRSPTSLDELLSANYMRVLPTDPMTNQKDWQTQYEDVVLSADQTGTGITDVHSASDRVSPFEGTAYNTW